ncbi:MAG: hypothetical protein HQL69_03330 [Magnetococcales bacterium]|nr:hypothetical protein [Magnetococcales bacterium]
MLPYQFLILLLCFSIFTQKGFCEQKTVEGFTSEPRTILSLHDDSKNSPYWFDKPHKLAEMPLNHIGLLLRNHNLSQPLPSLSQMKDVRGVLLWMSTDRIADPNRLLRWAIDIIAAGKKLVVMGTPPFDINLKGETTPGYLMDRFWGRLGLKPLSEWVRFTHKVQLIDKNPRVMDFERTFSGVLPSYKKMVATDPRVKVHLTARQFNKPETDTVLVATGPNGGYVAESFALYTTPEGDFIQWYINPFNFFAKAFATDKLAKLDATTMSNRRIYFSHIDGDGWRNLTQIDEYSKDKKLSSEVILKEILEKYPDLPVTVAPIAGDFDERLGQNPSIKKIAKKAFALKHVEIGSHTYSHPLFWQFFEEYSEDKEQQYLWLYPQLKENDFFQQLKSLLDMGRTKKKPQMDTGAWKQALNRIASNENERIKGNNDQEVIMEYRTPRAYYFGPYSLAQEIAESVKEIEKLAPEGKKVKLFQWSGDTLPYEDAILAVEEAGMKNINGGDSRFDRQFPSISWVAPLGRRVGSAWQTYSSNSNENTYTELWSSNFFGFKHLVKTVHNTGTPLRLKPFNVYYHMYSGEKTSSLNALRFNLDYARSLPLTPIAASHFASVVEGAIGADLQRDEKGRWRIVDRGALNTVRFDQALFTRVDFNKSEGVLGQKHHQGSLYIALDKDHEAPIIALTDHPNSGVLPSGRPYMVESSWMVGSLSFPTPHSLKFNSHGYGSGEFVWKTPWKGQFEASLIDDVGDVIDHHVGNIGKNGVLKFSFGSKGLPGGRVEIKNLETD